MFSNPLIHAPLLLLVAKTILVENEESLSTCQVSLNYIIKIINYIVKHWRCQLIMVFSIFRPLYSDRPVLPLFISYCYSNGMKQMPNHWSTSCDHFLSISNYHSNSFQCNSIIKMGFTKLAFKLQLLTNSSEGFRATLVFWNFKVALKCVQCIWMGNFTHYIYFLQRIEQLRTVASCL